MPELTLKSELTTAMTTLAADPARRFIGYGLRRGRAGGTLAGVPESQIIETTVAENLMVGMATGLSLAGLKPVVYIERADFLLNCMDALVNHLVKIKTISRGEFAPAAIIRVVVGNRQKPLFTGPTHTQDFCGMLEDLFMDLAHDARAWRIGSAEHVASSYEEAANNAERGITTVLFEYKDQL